MPSATASSTETLNGYAARLARGAAAIAVAVALLGTLVLLGWWLDIAVLKGVLPQWVTMKPNTAIGFLLAGTALWLQRNEPVADRARLASRICAALVALLGLLTLAEILSGRDFGIDNLLFTESATAIQSAAPGQMSPATAFCFLFAGMALLLIDAETRRGLRPAQWLMLPPLAISFVAVAGYIYGTETLYRVGPFSSVALHTALAFPLLGLGLFWARPTRGLMTLVTSASMGGMLVRRLLPVVLAAIPLLFWLRLLGERAGYYGTEFGIALMVLANISLLGGAFWWSAHAINHRVAGQRRAEAELRKLSLVVEQGSENVVITDLEGNIEYVNAAFVRNTGYSREEAIGNNPRFLGSGKTPKESIAALWDALTHGQPWKGELINRRKDGNEYVDFAIIAPLRQPDGTISHYVGVQEDITDRKRAGAELEQYRQHLEELVVKRTAQLEQAKVQAEAATQAKSAFLANMSHEIRTPLNAVLGLARIGMRENQGRKTGETCKQILDSGQHLLGVINDILDFSKIESGKLTVERLPFQPAAVIANACSFVTGAANEKGLDFHVETVGTLPEWVLGDPLRLQQILTNLLSNAVKFTARGTVRLVVSRDGDAARFAVIDKGIGMTAEQVGRLFRPFEQADDSTTRQYGGTGLGLAISQRLAGLMDGAIKIASTPGEGSTFTLNLPLPATEPPEQVAAEENSALAERRLDGLRILAAEDIDINRMILADMLEQAGASYILVENGELAVEQVARDAYAFDVVLMDVQMPVMDGYAATRRIREIAPGLPVIGLTAHAFAEERAQCETAGMVDHVTKPIEPDDLIAAIARQVAAPVGAPATTPGAVLPAPTFAVPAAAGLIDWSRLHGKFAARAGFVTRLVQMTLENQQDTPGKLRAAAAEGRFDELALMAHNLCGVAGNLEATSLMHEARQLISAARDRLPEACTMAEHVAGKTGQLIDELREHLVKHNEAPICPAPAG